jgi:epoxyqueuosine reductase
MLKLSHIKSVAASVGFDLCGVVRCQNFDSDRLFLEHWLSEGYGDGLTYLERNIDKRADATKLVEGAKSVIVCAVSYKNRYSCGYPPESKNKIASYALTTDYHINIKRMLQNLCAELKQSTPTLSGRCFTDSAPIFEKRYAVEAGLGWIGRQSLLVTPQFGSFVLLGVAVVTEECDSYDAPYSGIGCAKCRRCIDACPNSAIHNRHIDTRRCISRATVEKQAEHSTPLHGWIFGCDECQSCCPYNIKAPLATNPLFAPTIDPTSIDWQKMSEAEFKLHFATSPLSRTTVERIKQNID